MNTIATINDYSRLDQQVDVDIMQRSTITIIGFGGIASAAYDMAGLGVGSINVVDDDIVSNSSTHTADFMAIDIDEPKATVAARRILSINPDCNVTSIIARDDDLSPEAEERLWGMSSLVLSMTDDPLAQARMNRRSLQYRRDMLTGAIGGSNQVWELHGNLFPEIDEGHGCFRCFAHDRLEAYAAGRTGRSFYPSHRASTAWFNAAIVFVAVGLLHHRAGSPLPIAAYGKAFTEAPFLFGLIDPSLADEEHPVFGGYPIGCNLFATRQMARPQRTGWICPDCGTERPRT